MYGMAHLKFKACVKNFQLSEFNAFAKVWLKHSCCEARNNGAFLKSNEKYSISRTIAFWLLKRDRSVSQAYFDAQNTLKGSQ